MIAIKSSSSARTRHHRLVIVLFVAIMVTALSTRNDKGGLSLVNIDFLNSLPACATGFYYLWWPSASGSARQ